MIGMGHASVFILSFVLLLLFLFLLLLLIYHNCNYFYTLLHLDTKITRVHSLLVMIERPSVSVQQKIWLDLTLLHQVCIKYHDSVLHGTPMMQVSQNYSEKMSINMSINKTQTMDVCR